MIEQIISTFNKMLLDACERYAKELFVTKDRIQIRFGLDRQTEMRLTICKDGVAVRDEPLGKIMGLKYVGGIPLVYGTNAFVLGAAPPFITNALIGLCNEHQIEPLKIFVYGGVYNGTAATGGGQAKNELRLFLKNFDAYVTDLSLKKLVTGQDEEPEE